MTGAELKAARQAKGMGISDLARASGVNRWTISDLERGRVGPHGARLETLNRLQAALRDSRPMDAPDERWRAFGLAFRLLRHGAGLSLADVSDRLGVRVDVLAEMEKS